MKKNYLSRALLIVAFLLASMNIFAQGGHNFRINEIMTDNCTSAVDEYGRHGAWVELFNDAYAMSNLSGTYLINDPKLLDPNEEFDLDGWKKYQISKSDTRTQINSRQTVMVWLDGDAGLGTFHSNILPDTAGSNFLAVVTVDGRGHKIIADSITYPQMGADQSFARVSDGNGEFKVVSKATPGYYNQNVDTDAKSRDFKENDPTGLGMALTAMSVVFLTLLILFIAFKYIGKASIAATQRRAKAAAKKDAKSDVIESSVKKSESVSGDVYAAIALALHQMQNDLHDEENTVLTIDKVERRYSPWNSKLYGMMQNPRR